jgi:hypothetical protein
MSLGMIWHLSHPQQEGVPDISDVCGMFKMIQYIATTARCQIQHPSSTVNQI